MILFSRGAQRNNPTFKVYTTSNTLHNNLLYKVTMVEIAFFFYILMTKFSCTGNDIPEAIHVQLQWVSAKNLMQ